MKDPVGSQGRIKSNEYSVSHQKLIDGGGADGKYGGGFNKKSGTSSARKGKVEGKWQGKVSGGNRHYNDFND